MKKFYLITIFLFAGIVFTTCKKDDENNNATSSDWHYSLSKIIYLQTASSMQMPTRITLNFYSFIITDTIFSQSQLPYTHDLPDSALYNIQSTPYIFWYKEIDALGDTSGDFQCRAFIIL